MNAKGNIIVITRTNMIAGFGEERWNAFMTKLVQKDNYFSTMIMSVTLVPVEKVMIFFDAMCKEFFNNDKAVYPMYGKMGAKSLLSPGGPHQAYMLTKDINQFVKFVLPKIWSIFFDAGIFTTKFENNIVHIKITGVKIKNFDFENIVMGYNQQALKIFGRKSVAKRVRSLSAGDDDIYFLLELKDA
jgi:hypothetical protein